MQNDNTLEVTQSDSSEFIAKVVEDYRISFISRQVSYMARREVLTGKAKFGIVGDGKELPQVCMSHFFREGDFRSGYYRDQTFMFAAGLSNLEEFFAQLYADAENDPFSGGRQMNSHYATAMIDKNGEWTNHTEIKNISSDISCTAGQMARAVGLALASKKYRENKAIAEGTKFSNKGDEITFVTIGDASTSEGVFWESINAAAVMQIPMLVNVWDDGYGISVPIEFQTTKGSISKALAGFESDEEGVGIDMYEVNGWDYASLIHTYDIATEKIRRTHKPALIHVKELTQPQGHSTSGSHERYKSKERLEWEKDRDCIDVMRKWMLENEIISEDDLKALEEKAIKQVKDAKKNAWQAYINPVKKEIKQVKALYKKILADTNNDAKVASVVKELETAIEPLFAELVANTRKVLFALAGKKSDAIFELSQWYINAKETGKQRYNTKLMAEGDTSALNVPVIPAQFSDDSKTMNGYEVLNNFFDIKLEEKPELYAFGEDVGQIGDVNQGFAGLQEKYGIERVFDTGIREWTIMGQALGMSMRGLRPIAEIQYLDYLLYGLEPLSDDMATLRYRSNGLQAAPAIIRTRGHRLEGIWHAGSPIGMLLNALRGMYVCVPRNMTQAAGMYNTLLQSMDPALVIECLNGYRLKEQLPDNLSEFTVPLGVPEVLNQGDDITLVTYGSCVRIAQKAIKELEEVGISVELIDIQTILPFDLEARILESLKKTNKIIFMDEDVPGGATAYMMQEVLEKQGGYQYLDANPVTLSAKAHRPPYGSDGDYFTKPNEEDVFETCYKMMRESEPDSYPDLPY